MKQAAWKDWLPHILTVLVFLIIASGYFSPALGGDILYQGDISSYMATSKEARDFRDATGEEPLWTNSLFGGMPAYQVSMKNPGNLFIWLRKIVPRPISFLFVSMVGAWIMLLAFGANKYVAAVGGLAYGLNTYLITFIEAGHNSKSDAVAWMPFVIAGVHMLFRGKYWQGAALATLGMVMEVTVNHLQITYYLMLMVGIWGISELIYAAREGRIAEFGKSAVILIAVILIGVGASSTRILTTVEYTDWTIRGPSELSEAQAVSKAKDSGLDREYAFAWSYGIQESMTVMFPNFSGGKTQRSFASEEEADSKTLNELRAMASNPKTANVANQLGQYSSKYWGGLSFTGGPVYIGAVICFLFILGCLIVPARFRWWIIGVTFMSFVLSWGRYLPGVNNLLFDILPGYNKFRTVMMAFVIADLSMVLMAVLAVQEFLFGSLSAAQKRKALFTAAGVAGVLILYALSAGALFDPLSPRDKELLVQNPQFSNFFNALSADRTAMIRTDALRTLAFVGLTFGLLFYAVRTKMKPLIMAAVLGVLVTVDLMGVNVSYLNKENFTASDVYERSFNQQLPNIGDKDPHYRVLNVNRRLDQDGLTSFRYKSLGGYHGAKSRRFQDLVDRYRFNLPLPVLNMLNTKYVIGQNNQVQRNPRALGNAWLVDDIIWANNADEEIASLDSLRPSVSVIIREEDRPMIGSFKPGSGNSGTISLTDYKPNQLSYKVDIPAERLAVFSEMYYRGNTDWIAYVDGEQVDHFRANYMLRSMVLPAGQHELVFKFDPPSFRKGVQLSMLSSILAWLIILGAIVQLVRTRKEGEETQSEPA